MDGVRGRAESVPLGAVAGLVMAMIGAGVWMAVHLVYVALGVGLVVGLAVRLAGNGRSAMFGLMAVISTALACLSGEVLARIQAATSAQHDFYDTLVNTDLVQMVTAIFAQASPVDYVVYAVSLVGAYLLAIRS